MAKGRKPRTDEVRAVFDGLKFCSSTELQEVIKAANKLMDEAKEKEIAELERQIANLNGKLERLKK